MFPDPRLCRLSFEYPGSAGAGPRHKVMFKILQARLQQSMNCELPDVQAGFRKDRGTRDQIVNIHWIFEKESSRKTSTSALLTTSKPLIVWTTTNCGKFFKRWEYQTTVPASREICMLVKRKQLELNSEQQTGSKLGKEYIKFVYCHSAYLTYMQSTSCKMPQAGIKTGRRNIKNFRYADNITLMAEELKSLLMKVKEESEKVGLKLNNQKLRSWHLVPLLHGK